MNFFNSNQFYFRDQQYVDCISICLPHWCYRYIKHRTNTDYKREWEKQNWCRCSGDAAVKSWINYLLLPIRTCVQMNSVALTHMVEDVICDVACHGWMKVVSIVSVRERNFSTYASQTYYAEPLASVCIAHKCDQPWRVIWNKCYKCKICHLDVCFFQPYVLLL